MEKKQAAADTRPRARRPTHEEISLRAYALYLERGSSDGHDVEDWLEAERILTSLNEPAARAS